MVIDVDTTYPMWRAIFVRPGGADLYCDVEIADPQSYSIIYTVKRGQILHVRSNQYYSDSTTASQVIALY